MDIVVGLLVPEECTDGHLQLLAQLAELFSQEDVRERLRSPVSPSRRGGTALELDPPSLIRCIASQFLGRVRRDDA